jgi:hypothetical protein
MRPSGLCSRPRVLLNENVEFYLDGELPDGARTKFS